MRFAFKNFSGGELSPTLSARYDLGKYASGLQLCENFLPELHGGLARRPGTRFVADLGEASVLLPFSFNSLGAQNFCLVFGNRRLRIARTTGMLPVSLETPYALEDVYSLSHVQIGDVMYFAHRNYPLHKLTRSGSAPDYAWAFELVTFNRSLAAPGGVNATFAGEPNGHTLRYKVTAVDAKGVDSLPSAAAEVAGRHPSDWVQGNRATVRWNAVAGAVEYNIYREEAGYYGFIGTSRHTSFVDNNYEADLADTPRENWAPFQNGNPCVVSIHQQRLVLGGTSTQPHAFYMSRTGDFENFRKARPLQDDDPVEYLLGSGSVDGIVWATSFGDLLIGTSGAEYKATGDNGVITPKNVSITAQSYWGSAMLPPLVIGNSVLHCQRHGAHVRDLYYSLEKDGYSGNDLSILAPHLFNNHALLQWCYQQTPGSRVWCVRDDGLLLAMTYMKEHDIYGWSRHTTPGGKFLSVCALSGDTSDVVLCVTRRRINGQDRYYLETMADQWDESRDRAEMYFVDAGKTFRFSTPTREITGLAHLEGQSVMVVGDGSIPDMPSLVVSGGTLTLPVAVQVAHVGLGYASTMRLLPVEADAQNGSTMGKRRAYGKAVVRVSGSVGLQYSACGAHWYGVPELPARWGEGPRPFSGDYELSVPGGQTPDTTLWLRQVHPLPLTIVGVAVDVNFGEE